MGDDPKNNRDFPGFNLLAGSKKQGQEFGRKIGEFYDMGIRGKGSCELKCTEM